MNSITTYTEDLALKVIEQMTTNKHTREGYINGLKSFKKYCVENTITSPTSDDLTAWREWLMANKSEGTAWAYVRSVKAIYRIMSQRYGVIDIGAGVKTPRTPDRGLTPTVNDFKSIQKNPPTTRQKMEAWLMMMIMFVTACRVGALCGIRVRDIDLKRRVIEFKTKGGRLERRPIAKELIIPLRKWCAGMKDDDYLFVLDNGKPMNRQGVSYRLKQYTGDSALSAHCFRVCSITRMLELGKTLDQVMLFAGHKNMDTTLMYDRRRREVDENLTRGHWGDDA